MSDFNKYLTLWPVSLAYVGEGFLSHVAPPKHVKSEASAKAAPLASLHVQCGAESLLLAGCSSAEPVSSSALRGTKLVKFFVSRSVFGVFLWPCADKTVFIGVAALDNGESLPYKLVRNRNQSNFAGLPIRSQPSVWYQ